MQNKSLFNKLPVIHLITVGAEPLGAVAGRIALILVGGGMDSGESTGESDRKIEKERRTKRRRMKNKRRDGRRSK